ncbi:hypothetical protein DITRI_Ditri20bG0071200 [Diplodiscus trichospermus]
MTMYKIKLVGPKGEVNKFEAPDYQYILHAAEAVVVELPYCCKSGSCSICAGKIVSSSVGQSDSIYLEDEQIEAGYLLTCVLYPTFDCVIHTHRNLIFTHSRNKSEVYRSI